MIKAILLIFRPVQTWNNISVANRSIAYIFCLHLLPVILLTSAAEGYGLTHWGKTHNIGSKFVKIYSPAEAVVIETIISLTFIGLVFLGAAAARSYSSTFHRRSTYKQAFTAIAYGLAPLFSLRLIFLSDAMLSCIPWAIGLVLAIGAIYTGLPCMLKPDPPHAFGLYVMTSLTLSVIFGLWQLVTWQFFVGRFPGLEKIIANLAGVTAGGAPPL